MKIARRSFLTTAASVGVAYIVSSPARALGGAGLPWEPGTVHAPTVVGGEGWRFLDDREARLLEAIVERLIPADELSVGGKDAGCAAFIDAQLAGPYGSNARVYMQGPFHEGLPTQGWQSPQTPAALYRGGLAALDDHCEQAFDGRVFAELASDQQDAVLGQLERGEFELAGGLGARAFFDMVLADTRAGFFADPVHGGNRDLASWRMLGFPGVRYDFRDHIDRHNEPYPLPPVGLLGRASDARG